MSSDSDETVRLFLEYFGGHSDGSALPVSFSSGMYHYYPELDCLILRMLPEEVTIDRLHAMWKAWLAGIPRRMGLDRVAHLDRLVRGSRSKEEAILLSILLHELVNHRRPFVQSSVGTLVATLAFKGNVACAHWLKARQADDAERMEVAAERLAHHQERLDRLEKSTQIALETLALGWDCWALIARLEEEGEKNPRELAVETMLRSIGDKEPKFRDAYSHAFGLASEAVRLVGIDGLDALCRYALNPPIRNHREDDLAHYPGSRLEHAIDAVKRNGPTSAKATRLALDDVLEGYSESLAARSLLVRELGTSYPDVLEPAKQLPSPDFFLDPRSEGTINQISDFLLVTDTRTLSTTLRCESAEDRRRFMDHVYLTLLRKSLSDVFGSPQPKRERCPNFLLFGNCDECIRATGRDGPRVAKSFAAEFGFDICDAVVGGSD